MVFEGTLTQDDEDPGDYYEIYRPTQITPAPHILTLKNSYPETVRNALLASFPLVWIDRPATAVRLRVTLERLMDAQGIEGQQKDRNGVLQLSSKGRPKPRPLETRLEEFAKRGSAERRLRKIMDSVKWLGNQSAHDVQEIGEEALFHGFYILEATLDYLYEGMQIDPIIDYYSQKVDVFHHPERQATWPILVQ